jgi:carboxyl-terminal processing protease
VTREAAIGLASAALALAACVHRAPQPTYDRAAGLATFDEAWRIVHETHFDTTFNGVDWVALRDSLRPLAAQATREDRVRGLILDMLGRLGQSHFMLIPRERAETPDPARERPLRGTTGLDVRLVGDRVLVTRVDSGSAAARAGVRTGWAVVAIGRDTVAPLLRRLRERVALAPVGGVRVETAACAAAYARLQPPLDSTVDVVFLDAGDRPVAVRLASKPEPSEPIRFGALPTLFARFTHERVDLQGGGCAGLIRFTGWLPPLMRRLDAAVDADRACRGMVLDLRGNTGGMGAMLGGVAGHFLEHRDTLGLMRTRRATLAFVANPRRVTADARAVRPFAGPLAVLIDEGSASASEVFAGGMQALGRARVFGRTSMGAVLGATWDRLPNGDVLYHALGDFSLPGGRRLEGRGVAPDDSVTASRADLLAGRDPALDAALHWITVSPTGATP